jgi:hypothetical protein
MQASKIKVKKVYAVNIAAKHEPRKLARFWVSSVTTSRVDDTGSPHDYSSMVSGQYLNDAGLRSGESVPLKPEQILGPFEEFMELVAKDNQEKEAKEAAAQAKNDDAMELARWLYAQAGVPMPNDLSDYKEVPFRVSRHGWGVDIQTQGVALLLAAIRAKR